MMRRHFFILLLLSAGIISCQEDPFTEVEEENNIEFEGNKAVIKAGDLSNLRFKEVPGSISLDEAIPEGEIRVEGAEDLEEWLEVKEAGSELRIEGKEGFPAAMDLNFYLNPLDIAKIVVEGDNKILITATPLLEYLELVTEGASELIIHNLKVKNLRSRREGKSRMFLSSELSDFERDSIYFVAGTVELLDENYIVYTEEEVDYLLYAPEVKVRNDSVFALGYETPLRSYFITGTHDLRNEGESFLEALELPTLVVTSKNEGESESSVWALNQLDVKGEGESVMYFRGNPTVKENLNGSSALIRLE